MKNWAPSVTRPRVFWVPHDGCKWFFVEEPYPMWGSDEWIEYIPPPESRVVELDGALWWQTWDDDGGWFIWRMTNGAYESRT